MFVSRKVFGVLLLGAIAAGMIRCSGGSGGSASSGDYLTLSGAISLSNGSSTTTEESIIAQSVDITQYKVTCSTTTTPVKTGTSDIGSDGSFTAKIEGATNQPLTCFLTDSTGKKAADFLISDSSSKDLNGNNSTSTNATFKQNASLGTINFDPNAGEVTVPVTNIASVVSTEKPAAASVFDPTGSWTIGAVDFTLPTGTKSPCASSDSSCKGPQASQQIYFKLWKGIKTADSSDIYGLQLWNGQSKFTSCGSVIGLTSTAKTQIGVDFSANGSADAIFGFATSVASFTDSITSTTGTVNLTSNWKMSTAKLLHDVMPLCGPHDITAGSTTYSNAWVCGPDNSSDYQAQLGGGCVNSSNQNVDVRDWTGITCGSVTTNTDGIKSNTCTGNATINGVSTAVTCSNKWAVVNSSYVVQPAGDFNWSELSGSVVPVNTTCASVANGGSSNALKIAQLQCYAEYFDRSGFRNANACLPRVEMDWSATTPTSFEKVDLIRPEGLIFFEQFKPFTDGSGGSMTTRQEHFQGVQVKDSWVNCRVIETGSLTIKKITDSKMLATYQSATITTSITKPACLGKFTGARETFVFYLTK
ncbi:MAG: hypothetical protein IPM97_10170 [Bdellovibrionaceae bacterium]|nr:hypothetical protein [Pseudobdellovibrionaceae bacterium]